MTQKTDATYLRERRGKPRLATRLVAAMVEDPKHGTLVFTADRISGKGAYLQRVDKNTPLPGIGSLIKVTLRWPVETNTPTVCVAARVVRQTSNGVGVQYETTEE